MRVTLRDIAVEAGVSVQTVSNVVRGNTARVSVTTTERVRAIIAERGYVPNASARALAANSSRTIGLLVPARGSGQLLTPYDIDMLGSLEREFRARGFDLLLRGVERPDEVREVVQTWNLFGAVLLEFGEDDLERLDPIGDAVLVALDAHIASSTVRSVRADDEDGGRLAARRLVEAGHTRIAFAGELGTRTTVIRARLAGFRAELERAGIPDPELLQVPLTHEAGYALASQWAHADAPTAVFAAADILAIGLLQGLADRGIRVPADVSVIGFDDLATGQYVTPRLTTIAQDFAAKSAAVCALLFDEADAAGQATSGPISAGAVSAGLDSAGAVSAGLDSAGAVSAGLDSAGAVSAGPDSAGLDSAGAVSAGPVITSVRLIERASVARAK